MRPIFNTNNDKMPAPNFKNFVWSGTLCCYNSCEIENILIGCAGAGTQCCIEGEACCGVPNAANPMKPVGMVKEEGKICKFSLPCCACALICPPKVCCASSGQCLCMKGAASFPLGAEVPKPVCAICGFQCAPNVGCLQPYDAGGGDKVVPGAAKMVR